MGADNLDSTFQGFLEHLDRVLQSSVSHHSDPRIRKEEVLSAVQSHLERVGLGGVPVRWASDARDFIDRIWDGNGTETQALVHRWEDEINRRLEAALRSSAVFSSQADGKTMGLQTNSALINLDGVLRIGIWDLRSTAWAQYKNESGHAVRCHTISGIVSGIITWGSVRPLSEPVWEFVKMWLPFLEALAAGLWLWQFTEQGVLVCSLPHLKAVNGRLHSPDSPAVWWDSGSHPLYYWRGMRVKDYVIAEPQRITLKEIDGERNIEIRRVLIEKYGLQRFVQDSGAEAVDRVKRVEFGGGLIRSEGRMISLPRGLYGGVLWRVVFRDDENLQMVQVINSTPEEDGKDKNYFIRVPPTVSTVAEAVAWTFGLSAEHYHPAHES